MNIVNNFSEVKQTPVNSQVKSVSPTGVKPDLEYKPDILDIASEKIINKRDITDTVTMPRTIFKGYLCFTVGTAMNAIAGVLGKNKFSKALSVLGSVTAILGTFNFVKPFLIKENKNNSEKDLK